MGKRAKIKTRTRNLEGISNVEARPTGKGFDLNFTAGTYEDRKVFRLKLNTVDVFEVARELWKVVSEQEKTLNLIKGALERKP